MTDAGGRGKVAAMDPPALDPAAHALFLDFDGTLVEIAARPDLIAVAPDLPSRLAALATKLAGRLAVVSGRSIAAIDALTGGAAPFVAGLHGLEWRGPDGRHAPAPTPEALAAVRDAFGAFAAARPGVLLEDKGASLALHYRAVPELAAQAVDAACRAVEGVPDLVVQRGKAVVEVRPAGADKGTAVAALYREMDAGDRVPVFLGDDLTDEPGFAMAESLGGLGIRIGPQAPTAASSSLPDVEAAKAWLFAGLGV